VTSFNNAWFHRTRHELVYPWASWDLASHARPLWATTEARDRRTVRTTRQGCAAGNHQLPKPTERMLNRLPVEHEASARAHMQFFRSCLEATSIVPADEIMHAAVQLEWLWYTTPFKGFYRDHLAHVMKVATVALTLWRSADCVCQGRLIDRIAAQLADCGQESVALRRAALRLGNEARSLRDPRFWRQAVLEATRLACLLHDMAYPSIMAGKYVTPAAAITDPIGPPGDERAHLTQRALTLAEGRLLMEPFLGEDAATRRQGQEAFVEMALTSHSLQAGLRILQLGLEVDRIWRLTPLEAFIIEWAAAAAALHDYDKAFELHLDALHDETSKPRNALEYWFDRSELGRQHAERIRPSLRRDPVSYMVALADQLQDFGRVHLDASLRDRRSATVRIAAPVREVTLAREGSALTITWALANDASEENADAVRKDKLGDSEEREIAKQRGAAGTVFWPPEGEQSWLDHGGLFDGITARVE